MKASLTARDFVRSQILLHGWFTEPGAYAIVDGQFGSTGKGLLAGLLADVGRDLITVVTTNAGPNSGHTAYMPSGAKIMTQQLPIGSFVLSELDKVIDTYVNAGAIIDPDILRQEIALLNADLDRLHIHPCAAMIDAMDVANEADPLSSIAAVASTGKGVGSALARKVLRLNNTYGAATGNRSGVLAWDWTSDVVMMETPQGFSLGVNSPQFHPYTTSRECTVMQALSDARIPPGRLRKVAACYRTFPIRVGNTSVGESGPGYPDQQETNWEDIGQEPELTSVTKRVRRVFTWSRMQFRESIAANEPDLIFLNFCNYLDRPQVEYLVRNIREDYAAVVRDKEPLILLGHGAHAPNVSVALGK